MGGEQGSGAANLWSEMPVQLPIGGDIRRFLRAVTEIGN